MEVDCIVFLLQKLQQGPVLSKNCGNNLYSIEHPTKNLYLIAARINSIENCSKNPYSIEPN